jgi:glycosyltransferase involved in cell wall biosynthesis
MNSPLVTVIMASYNHEPFVLEAVESVLAQKGVELEFLVEDDGSSDRSCELLEGVHDPRFHFFRKPANQGAYATHNNLLRRARGKFVALINSDDLWPDAEKLAYQADVLLSNPQYGATFGRARFIDANGDRVPPSATSMGGLFEQENRSQGRWLRRFFESGNCLCHPTVMIRRECHETLGYYDNRLRQIADFEMWLRLVKRWNIHVSERELVEFRWIEGHNTSFPSARTLFRTRNEEHMILRHVLDDVDEPLMREGFGDMFYNQGAMDARSLEVEKVLLYFRVEGHLGRFYWQMGLSKIFDLLGRQDMRAVLADYGIDDLWLHEEAAQFSSFIAVRQLPAAASPQPAAAPAPEPVAAPAGKPLSRYFGFLKR